MPRRSRRAPRSAGKPCEELAQSWTRRRHAACRARDRRRHLNARLDGADRAVRRALDHPPSAPADHAACSCRAACRSATSQELRRARRRTASDGRRQPRRQRDRRRAQQSAIGLRHGRQLERPVTLLIGDLALLPRPRQSSAMLRDAATAARRRRGRCSTTAAAASSRCCRSREHRRRVLGRGSTRRTRVRLRRCRCADVGRGLPRDRRDHAASSPATPTERRSARNGWLRRCSRCGPVSMSNRDSAPAPRRQRSRRHCWTDERTAGVCCHGFLGDRPRTSRDWSPDRAADRPCHRGVRPARSRRPTPTPVHVATRFAAGHRARSTRRSPHSLPTYGHGATSSATRWVAASRSRSRHSLRVFGRRSASPPIGAHPGLDDSAEQRKGLAAMRDRTPSPRTCLAHSDLPRASSHEWYQPAVVRLAARATPTVPAGPRAPRRNGRAPSTWRGPRCARFGTGNQEPPLAEDRANAHPHPADCRRRLDAKFVDLANARLSASRARSPRTGPSPAPVTPSTSKRPAEFVSPSSLEEFLAQHRKPARCRLTEWQDARSCSRTSEYHKADGHREDHDQRAPQVRNSFRPRTIVEIREALDEARDDPEHRRDHPHRRRAPTRSAPAVTSGCAARPATPTRTGVQPSQRARPAARHPHLPEAR